LLEPRHPRPPTLRQPILDVFHRFRPRPPEVTDDLLLRHRTARTQPRRHPPCPSQHPIQPSRADLLTSTVGPLRRGDAFVPHPPTPVPLGQQRPVLCSGDT